MYAAASNLTVFFPSTILLYRQFILPSNNALFLPTAGETGGLQGKPENLGGRPEWRVLLPKGAASGLTVSGYCCQRGQWASQK